MSQVIVVSHITGAAALENKHSGGYAALHVIGRFGHFPLLCNLHVFNATSHFCLELSSRGNWLDSVIYTLAG